MASSMTAFREVEGLGMAWDQTEVCAQRLVQDFIGWDINIRSSHTVRCLQDEGIENDRFRRYRPPMVNCQRGAQIRGH